MDKEYSYVVTVIMAVYNVAPFLQEAVESLEKQTIGFDKIQLILVDDGSQDSSGEICDKYKSKYPQNVFVIHKPNGGVSSARNRGLEHIQGKYVNFMDPDDKLSVDAFENVVDFFEQHYEEIDMVAFPMVFFEARKGNHPLNYKFNGGNRVIDLNKEIDKIQLSLCSSVVKAEAFQTLQWDENLVVSEDVKLSIRILFFRCKLGVVKNAIYYYRKRSMGGSAIQSSTTRREWYIALLRNYFIDSIKYFEQCAGYIPRFVQYTMMYDLQWKLNLTHIPKGVMNEQERSEYIGLIQEILSYIDDDVILMQRQMGRERKIYALSIKYKREPDIFQFTNDVGLRFGDLMVAKFSEQNIILDFIEQTEENFVLEGHISVFPIENTGISIYADVNGIEYPSEITGIEGNFLSMDKPLMRLYRFRANCPIKQKEKQYVVKFGLYVGQTKIGTNTLQFAKFFPISKKYAGSAYIKNGWCLTWDSNKLHFDSTSRFLCIRKKVRQYWSLWKVDLPGAKKGVFVRIVRPILKMIYHKPIWVISDRTSHADDNGEALFRYIIENHCNDVKAYFVLGKNSIDHKRLKEIGPVLNHLSPKHKMLLLMSDCIISSQAEEDTINPFGEGKPIYSDILADIPFVFLQHGITKDNLSMWLKRSNKNIAGFITAAEPEYHSILAYAYDYTPKQVWLTGFPRFDALKNNPQKIITVMPTWRKYLLGSRDVITDIWSLSPNFSKSEFYQFYYDLLHNDRLMNAVRCYGYSLQFLPHPNILPYVGLFDLPTEVDIPSKKVSYRKIYETSSLVVTDYSSAVFDFAYLRKPVLYTQFDATSFFSGEHSYEKGYFDYERDGFGEVEYDLESTVDRIIEYMQNGCKLKDKYRERIDRFFAFNDQNNCQRVYEKIMKMEQEI